MSLFHSIKSDSKKTKENLNIRRVRKCEDKGRHEQTHGTVNTVRDENVRIQINKMCFLTRNKLV